VARSSGGINWRVRLEALCHACGAHLAQDADASPYLLVADVLVTDHSSVGFEFMLLDRPIVVLECPWLITMARISTDKVRRLRRAADVVPSADAAATAVTRALSAPASLSAERRATAADLFYEPGGATARAVQSVYDLLSLPAPDGRHNLEARPARAPVAITPTVAG
jgi:CDP-glycerol glycerophosphotransferase